jgi:hypothetical protein
MLKRPLFDLLIAIAVVVAIALSVREAFATSIVTSRRDAAIQCESLPSRYSIHTVEEAGMRVISSEDGPTGLDGGVKELYTAYRICSRK